MGAKDRGHGCYSLTWNPNHMMSLLNILQLEIHMFPAAFVLIVLLPFSSHNKIRYYGCYIAYIFLVSFTAILLFPVFLFRPKNVKNCIAAAEVLKHITKLLGIRWELRGADILGVQRGAVIVSNHQSIIDIMGIFNIWKIMGKCATVAKKQLFYIWPFGLTAWLAGVVFIDRNRRSVANSQLDDAARLVVEDKTKLWMFPEGTRNHNPDTFMEFKKGAFRVAIACQVPIIPVVYSPYYFLDHQKKYFGRGKIIIQCLEPISTEGMTENDVDSIIDEVRGKMVAQYELLKQEIAVFQETTNKNIY